MALARNDKSSSIHPAPKIANLASELALHARSLGVVDNCETFGHRPKSFLEHAPRLQRLGQSIPPNLSFESACCRRRDGRPALLPSRASVGLGQNERFVTVR